MKVIKNRGRRALGNLNSRIILLLLSFLLFLFLTIISVAGVRGFYEYIDMTSLVYMAGLAVLILIFSGMGTEFCNGVRIVFSKRVEGVSRMALQKAITAVKFARSIVFLEAGITAVISFVPILYNMSGLIAIGPPLSIISLSLLYAAIFALLTTVVSGRLEGILVAYMEGSDEEETIPDEQTLYFKLRALGLTDREAEVARLVSCEMTNKEIGQMLYISDTTVKKHITHILEKTGREDREKLTELVRGL